MFHKNLMGDFTSITVQTFKNLAKLTPVTKSSTL